MEASEAMQTKTYVFSAENRKSTACIHQSLAVLIRNVFVIGYGVTLGYPTILIPGLQDKQTENAFNLDKEGVSWIGSINMICVPIGCLFSGLIAEKIGRKSAMLIINVPLFLAWTLFQFSTKLWQIYLALCLTGVSGGLLETAVFAYVTEISQPHLRGIFLATNGFSYSLGILVQFVLGSMLEWRSVARVCCVIPIFATCLLFLIPESPYWFLTHNKLKKAQKSLAWLRGSLSECEIEHELQTMASECGKSLVINGRTHLQDNLNSRIKNNHWISNYGKFFKINFLWPLFIITFTFVLANFTGNMLPYAIQIFYSFHAPLNNYYATVILGGMQIVAITINVVSIKFFGKRITVFASLIGTGVCSLVVAVTAYVKDVKFVSANFESNNFTSNFVDYGFYEWTSCIFLILLDFCSNCGLISIPWILLAELYSNETRATGCCVSAIIGYIIGFVARKSFPKLVSLIELSGIYTFYFVVSFLGLLVLYFILPETEGKTLNNIQDSFTNKLQERNMLPSKEHACVR